MTDWLSLIERQHPVSIDLGLERVAEVAKRLGLLTGRGLARRVITVAGTNGKGSTVALLEALALAHGRSTAGYTSPHLLRYNERLRFDGVEASDEALIAGFERVEAVRLQGAPVSLTYFEVGTLAAFWSMAERYPDVAILEVGLGGRLDAVNVIDSDVAVVTTVAQDHAAFLGTDLNGIGLEKAGIMRAGRPAVLGSQALPPSVAAFATSLGARTHRLGEHFARSGNAAEWSWQGLDDTGRPLQLEAFGDPGLPLDNAATALQALALVGVKLERARCRQAFDRVSLPGRMQWLGRWCLDVAHNPHAAAYLAQRLAERPRPTRRIALLGMLGDKDAEGVIDALAPVVDAWLPVSLTGERARAATELVPLLKVRNQTVLPQAASPREGAAWLADQLGEDDEVLVCGSFFTVAEVLTWCQTKMDKPPAAVPAQRRGEGEASGQEQGLQGEGRST
ncbi:MULTISPECIES: bifunctional tetrahydrofolate synthase/dihydrofolate synthase [Halomonadaceae]|uniref:bifunctional tetrahydrofolate synthase/dihydrofolate synthase n=1 Tax=unclassified Halomonas TaxID=2609666 RepID=UPI00200E2D6A|nr:MULTISPECIES: bifunctional tetrahydrofolate synthase/dihydrofolate synthase [Halomonas]